MKRVKVSVFGVGVFAFGVSAAGSRAAAGTQKGRAAALERGRAVYSEHCKRCHGSDGQGRTRTDEWMSASVANGRGQMPAFRKKLTRQEIAASIAYVRTLGRQQVENSR